MPAQSQQNGCVLGCVGTCVLFCIFAAISQCSPKPHYEPTAEQKAGTGSWDDGYNQGVAVGKDWGRTGHGVPTAAFLHTAAVRACAEKVHPPNPDQWERGFTSGFEQGYKDEAKPAFRP